MKKFVFRFETILKYRRDKEEEIGEELALLQKELAVIDASIRNVEEKMRAFVAEMSRRQEEGVSVFEMRNAADGAAFFRNRRRSLELQRADAAERVESKRSELIEAMKSRKIMENLKAKAFEDYKEEFERDERKVIEEIVTYRGSRKEKRG